MNRKKYTCYFLLCSGISLFTQCSEAPTNQITQQAGLGLPLQATTQQNKYGGFNSQIEYGKHLVFIGGCHDCHSPKKMTEKGMEIDETMLLSGHPAKMPGPDIDRSEIEKKGLIVTQTLTAWAGPWGVSYAANLTSDKTGIGNWQEKNFIKAIREGKSKGMDNGRPLLPPMPWEMYKNMTDDELKAIFAYLKSTKPISNVVPAPKPPVTAPKGK
ncbi:c-type cytochrome [Pontibacter vulgaris]|uniref:c-type cytochrome n=1 Tax=Pontibacter vulgaris TaxID=2905679 RepID=UPI001FA7B4EE|nr:c-type cytochrome [Pontibacter vulgaris]